jgi:hypothetical protein
MKDFARAPVYQCQLLTPAGPLTMARKSPRTDDVALAWIKNAEVHSALVHVTDVSESRIGLWCPDFVPTGHTVLVASTDGTGSWGVVFRCTGVPSGYRLDIELNPH